MSQSATSVKPTLLLDLGNLHTLVIELLEWYTVYLVILMHCLFGKSNKFYNITSKFSCLGWTEIPLNYKVQNRSTIGVKYFVLLLKREWTLLQNGQCKKWYIKTIDKNRLLFCFV